MNKPATLPAYSMELPLMRQHFHIPLDAHGQPVRYFCGNSLGLMPRNARALVEEVLDAWAREGVEGHFKGSAPWMPYHELVREPLAELVGAQPSEVVAMNTLTVNLHLMLASFYTPNPRRYKILLEARAFPSDRHALVSKLRMHGFSAEQALLELSPEPGEACLRPEAVEAAITEHGEELALVLMPGVQYATGQAFDLAAISSAAHAVGALAGFDLAHAVGNLPLALHDSGADFAVWCSYKYLNSGPGAVAGCFVHARHAETDRPRLAGWWGHRADTRFRMGPEFVATPGADGWQLSNPPILSMAPLRASLALFQQATMPALRARSLLLTGALEASLKSDLANHLEILTPADPQQRGCQLSLRVRAGQGAGRAAFDALAQAGIIADWREPDVIRVAPAPLYNTLDDVDALSEALRGHFSGARR